MTHTPADQRNTGLAFTPDGIRSPFLDALQARSGLDPRRQATRQLARARAERAGGRTMLVLDVSGSMRGAPLAEAVDGAHRFNRECLLQGQWVGLVSFGSQAELLATCSPAGIAAWLAGLRVHGSTNMAAGITCALDHLDGADASCTLVIATDGYPDDADAAEAAATRARRRGVRILTVGTTDCDAGFLARIASAPRLVVVTAPGTLGRALAQSTQLLLE